MTVAELVNELSKLPPGHEVFTRGCDGCAGDCADVVVIPEHDDGEPGKYVDPKPESVMIERRK